jgi:N-acetylglucosaminyldiphosphoundecaprenol N-acetyl-beta-D-mannosaminyltransferase
MTLLSDHVEASLEAHYPPGLIGERLPLLGGVVDLVTPEAMIQRVIDQLAAGQQTVVANHNLHSLYLLRGNAEFRRFFEFSDIIQIDSMPLIWWARLMGAPAHKQHRCTYLDYRNAFWAEAQRQNWRVFHLGGAPETVARAAQLLRDAWGVEIGVHHGYFEDPSPQADDILAQIIDFRPDVLLVGMGMPRQEGWILRNRAALGACAIFSVGGAFDYEAGAQIAAPRWLGQLGLEWLFRLASNPRRLFYRYCVEPWSLLGPALADLKARLAH